MTSSVQQAIDFHQAGNLIEAERLYRAILAETPDNPDALALFGVLLDGKGEHERAVELIGKATKLDPKTPLFQLQLGNALMNLKRTDEAIAVFRNAAALQPTLSEAHYNIGNALRRIDDWKGAIASYCEAVRLNPGYAQAYNNLALALVHEKQYDEALIQAKKAVAVAPNFGEGWLTLCNVAEKCGDYVLAAQAGEHNIRLLPDNYRSWFGYGVALNRLHRHEEAIPLYKRSLELQPDRADIWDNLAQTYQSLLRLDEAEATFRKSIELAGQAIPDEDKREVAEEEYGNRHWHLALMELLRGKYKQGFARYRSRFREVEGLVRPKMDKPLWKGEDLKGKVILIHGEQGFGDTLMFARYLPLIKAQGGIVKFSAHPALEELFRNWPVVDEVIPYGPAMLGYHYYASVFDLPHRFRTTLETIPADVPYLPLLQPNENTRLSGDGRPKIGVVWGGSPLHKNDLHRSIPLNLFSKLFEETGAQFYSLNRDLKPGDAELLPKYSVIDLASRIKNFADATRIIGQLDLLITCDTATAHLAGALGKPVWTLITFSPDWRWMIGRDDSPWYPTMRLFRQPKGGDWESVINHVQQELELCSFFK